MTAFLLLKRLASALALGFVTFPALAIEQSQLEAIIRDANEVISERVAESYPFFGLAQFYNEVGYYIVGPNRIEEVASNVPLELAEGDWLAVSGRFSYLLLRVPGLEFQVQDRTLTLEDPRQLNNSASEIHLADRSELKALSPELDQLRYAHLWPPLAHFSRWIEACLSFLHDRLALGWGTSIILFAILFKIVFLPVAVWTSRMLRRVTEIQATLAPELARIKAGYKGEEAHNLFMAAHRKQGVTPFFAMRPALSLLIQIPFLVAIFNTLGEMDRLSGEGFLWIADLVRPDAVASLGVSVPLMGDTLNLLPILMAALAILSGVLFRNSVAPPEKVRQTRLETQILAVGLFVLFYPFPSAMVLYWTVATFLQILQQRLIKI